MENSHARRYRTSRSGANPPQKTDSQTTTPSRDERIAVKITFVVFKGEVVAIFRAIRDVHGEWVKKKTRYYNPPGTGRLVRLAPAYSHIGQHCEVDAALLKCRRATYEEYAPLLAEMRDIVGYDIDVVQHGRLRLKEKTGYAAVWCDDYDCDFGVYRVFTSRGQCLDYLTDMVFERAKLLEVDVVDQSAQPVSGKFPKMTWKQVRDQLGNGMDFCLVLRTSFLGGSIAVEEQVSVGIREVKIE